MVLLDSAGALAERAWHSSTVAQRSSFTSRCGSLGDPSARVFEVCLIVSQPVSVAAWDAWGLGWGTQGRYARAGFPLRVLLTAKR